MTAAEADIIRRYEIYRAAWLGRCKLLFQARPSEIENIAILMADESLSLIDEELVELEAQLPAWYPGVTEGQRGDGPAMQ